MNSNKDKKYEKKNFNWRSSIERKNLMLKLNLNEKNLILIEPSRMINEIKFLKDNLKDHIFYNSKTEYNFNFEVEEINLIEYQNYLLNINRAEFEANKFTIDPNYYFNLNSELQLLNKNKSKKIELQNFGFVKELSSSNNFKNIFEKWDDEKLFFRKWNFISLYFNRFNNYNKIDNKHFLRFYILNNYMRIIFRFLDFSKFKIKFYNIKIINTTDFDNNKKNKKEELYNLNLNNNNFIEEIIPVLKNNKNIDIIIKKIKNNDKYYLFKENISEEIFDLSWNKLIKLSKKNFIYTSFKYFMFFEKYCFKCLFILMNYFKDFTKNDLNNLKLKKK